MENARQRLEVGTQMGDYQLEKLLYDGPTTRTWKAHQISVSREVIIDSLNQSEHDNEDLVAIFLSDVRAKAHVDHPLICSVFEAVQEGDACFYARENLHGETLHELCDNGKKMRPEKVVHIIRQIAEANLYLEEHNIASLPIGSDQIFVTEHSLCRLINMAVGGERDHQVSTQDKHTIATTFIELLATNLPGSTRTRSLLDYMADLEREIPLTWQQIQELSEEVELHLSEPSGPIAVSTPAKSSKKSLFLVAGIGIGAALAFGIGSLFLNQPELPKERDLSGTVHIPAGNYLTHDGEHKESAEFWVDAHEVTIAEYANFLEKTKILNAEEIEVYQHPDQPDSKTDHKPDDWDNLQTLARSGGIWRGLQVDLNHPIVGIDWWDAFTYSAFTRRRLPTQEEWHAVLDFSKAKKLNKSGWGAADQATGDVTENGIHGLAGNVSEWTFNKSQDPAFPSKPEMPVACGSSYLKKGGNAASREWLSTEQTEKTDARSIRRADIGFRTISSSPSK